MNSNSARVHAGVSIGEAVLTSCGRVVTPRQFSRLFSEVTCKQCRANMNRLVKNVMMCFSRQEWYWNDALHYAMRTGVKVSTLVSEELKHEGGHY